MEVFENNNEITFIYDNRFIYTWMKPKLPQDDRPNQEKYYLYPITFGEEKPQLVIENYGNRVDFLFGYHKYHYYAGLPVIPVDVSVVNLEPLTYEKIANFENRCMRV